MRHGPKTISLTKHVAVVLLAIKLADDVLNLVLLSLTAFIQVASPQYQSIDFSPITDSLPVHIYGNNFIAYFKPITDMNSPVASPSLRAMTHQFHPRTQASYFPHIPSTPASVGQGQIYSPDKCQPTKPANPSSQLVGCMRRNSQATGSPVITNPQRPSLRDETRRSSLRESAIPLSPHIHHVKSKSMGSYLQRRGRCKTTPSFIQDRSPTSTRSYRDHRIRPDITMYTIPRSITRNLP